MPDPLIHAHNLVKTYRSGEVEVPAIRGVDFDIAPRSFVVFVGPSGSGKTTLLNMIGCLDHPTRGTLQVLGTDVSTLDRSAAADFRGKHIGFVFQDFNLVPVLTVYENIEYPLIMVQDWPAQRRREQVMRLIQAVGMAGQENKRPDQISGGQEQRVAVARARDKPAPGARRRADRQPGSRHCLSRHQPDEEDARRVRHHIRLLHARSEDHVRGRGDLHARGRAAALGRDRSRQGGRVCIGS
jgi:ABC-type lipoprotein export system ATPase subunit